MVSSKSFACFLIGIGVGLVVSMLILIGLNQPTKVETQIVIVVSMLVSLGAGAVVLNKHL